MTVGVEMSPFELVFALFGLLLGLAIAEVLGGFARVLKLKRIGGAAANVRIGWLTPLLGLLVILDQTSFWLTAYNLREVIPANYATLIIVLAIVGTYYLASTLIFPDDPDAWPDFDHHYDRQNRFILAAMLVANLAVLVFAGVLATSAAGDAMLASAPPPRQAGPIAGLIGAVGALATFPLLIALILVRSRRVNIALLLVLIGFNLAGALAALS
jgi:hypothetical protein